jgi:hypothetical protein
MGQVSQTPGLTRQQVSIVPGSAWARLPAVGGMLAVLGLGLSAYLGRSDPRQLYFSYLVAYLYFLSLALGAQFFVLVQFATRSGWSVAVRRMAEHTMGTLPLFALLFIPVVLGLHQIYDWTGAAAVAADHLLQHKRPYLNEPFFLGRAAIYLVAWSGIGIWFRRQSMAQDASGERRITRRLQAVSAPALIVYALTVTFASFDWLMTLDPHWYSTVFGVYFFAGAVVCHFALLALLALALRRAGLAAGVITVEHLHDMGKLLFAFVCFWAYIAFSQFMLLWYANIPEETIFYLRRLTGSWSSVSVLLALGHFVAPFFFLLPRTVKRSSGGLLLGALWMLGMHYLDLYWLVMPRIHPEGVRLSLLDLSTWMGVGGVFLAGLGWLMRHAALIPLKDPRLPESLSFEN